MIKPMTFRKLRDGAIKYLVAFMATWALQLVMGITVRNPLTVVLFACIYMGVCRIHDYRFVSGKIGFGISAGLSAVLSLAVAYLNYERLSSDFNSAIFKGLTAVILFVGFFFIFIYLYKAVDISVFHKSNYHRIWDEHSCDGGEILSATLLKTAERKVFAATTAICLLGYLPYFLYEFPGIMTADSLVQFGQIIGTEPVSNHHPIIHTLTIKLFYELGYLLTGSSIYGIACYTLAQMIFMAICAGVMVREIVRLQERVVVAHVFLTIVFLAFMPFNAVFAVTVWKDVPFAGIAVLLSCHLIEMFRQKKNEPGIKELCGFLLLTILFMLYRSNAFYAMILFGVVMAVGAAMAALDMRKRYLKVLSTMVAAIIVTFVIKGPVFDSFRIGRPDFTESLSVPLQQVAAVLCHDGNVSDRQLEQIDAVIDRTYIRELYAPNFADNIKELVRAGHPEVLEANKAGYLKLWLELLHQNPKIYIKAWYDLEGGYINPNIDYLVAEVDGIMPNDLGLYSEPIIGGKFIKIKEILIKLSDFMPLYGMLFSIGAYFWGLVISLLWGFRRKKNVLLHVLMLLIIGTLLIAAPVVDFRYGYAYVLTCPLWILILLVSV